MLPAKTDHAIEKVLPHPHECEDTSWSLQDFVLTSPAHVMIEGTQAYPSAIHPVRVGLVFLYDSGYRSTLVVEPSSLEQALPVLRSEAGFLVDPPPEDALAPDMHLRLGDHFADACLAHRAAGWPADWPTEGRPGVVSETLAYLHAGAPWTEIQTLMRLRGAYVMATTMARQASAEVESQRRALIERFGDSYAIDARYSSEFSLLERLDIGRARAEDTLDCAWDEYQDFRGRIGSPEAPPSPRTPRSSATKRSAKPEDVLIETSQAAGPIKLTLMQADVVILALGHLEDLSQRGYDCPDWDDDDDVEAWYARDAQIGRAERDAEQRPPVVQRENLELVVGALRLFGKELNSGALEATLLSGGAASPHQAWGLAEILSHWPQ
jgi:hypothetical protein